MDYKTFWKGASSVGVFSRIDLNDRSSGRPNDNIRLRSSSIREASTSTMHLTRSHSTAANCRALKKFQSRKANSSQVSSSRNLLENPALLILALIRHNFLVQFLERCTKRDSKHTHNHHDQKKKGSRHLFFFLCTSTLTGYVWEPYVWL